MRIILSIFSILISFVIPIFSASALDGNGLICQRFDNTPYAIKFVSGKVQTIWLFLEKDKVATNRFLKEYNSDPDFIWWSSDGTTLNRKTLEIVTKKGFVFASNCKLYKSSSEFEMEWKKVMIKVQENYDSKLKSNKL